MPPKIALFIGALFVYYAFRTAYKRTAALSSGLLLPTIWYLLGASHPLGPWLVIWGIPLPASNSDAIEGSPIDAYFYLFLTIGAFVILWRRRFKWGEAVRLNPWLVTLLAFMALSIIWSGYPYVSFKRYVKVLGAAGLALVVLTNDRPLQSVLTVLRRCLYIHLPMSIIFIKYFRDIGVQYDWSGTSQEWTGIATSKNTLGQVAMLGVLYFTWEIVQRWRVSGWRNLNVIYLLMAVYLLKGSDSAVSMTSVFVCVVTLLIFLRLRSFRSRPDAAPRFIWKICSVTIALIALVVVHSFVMFSESSVFGHLITFLGRDITLTGRTDIWHDCYAIAAKNPLFGVGFGGFWIGRIANIPWDAQMSWVLAQGHSGYVDTYLQIGIIGELLLAIVLLTTISRLSTSLDTDFDFNCYRITLLVAIMFINITESTYLRGDHHLWFILQLVIWRIPERVLTPRSTANTAAALLTTS